MEVNTLEIANNLNDKFNGEKRHISYSRQIVDAILGGLFFLIGIATICYLNHINYEYDYLPLILFIFAIGILFGLKGLSEYRIIKAKNDKLDNIELPYLFDYEKELSTYEMIGRENAKKKTAKNKKLKNNADYYEKYTEWKEHIKKDYLEIVGFSEDNRINFNKYLKSNLYRKELLIYVMEVLIIPVELGIIASFGNQNIPFQLGGIIILNLVLALYVTNEVYNCKLEEHFLNDLIEIIEE